MVIGILNLQFYLAGCSSLKEKRQRLGKLRDRFGRLSHIAVCESDLADSHQHSQWSFVVTAGSHKVVERSLQQISVAASTELDAIITDERREFL